MMLALLVPLAWGQSPSKDGAPYAPPPDPALRIGLGALEGAAIGGASGTLLGMGIAAAVVESWENDACTDCDRSAFVFVVGGGFVGVVTGGTIGAVVAANRVSHRTVAVAPVGPGLPGITVLAEFW